METKETYEFIAEDPKVNVRPIVISIIIGAFLQF